MNETELEEASWVPMKGRMTDAEARTLGIQVLPKTSYWAMWFFDRPLIIQFADGVMASMSASIQNHALHAIGVKASA